MMLYKFSQSVIFWLSLDNDRGFLFGFRVFMLYFCVDCFLSYFSIGWMILEDTDNDVLHALAFFHQSGIKSLWFDKIFLICSMVAT